MWRKHGVRIALAICWVAACLVGARVAIAQTAVDTSVARARAKHLQHGINMSEWFAQVYSAKGYTKEHFETWNTVDDMVLDQIPGI